MYSWKCRMQLWFCSGIRVEWERIHKEHSTLPIVSWMMQMLWINLCCLEQLMSCVLLAVAKKNANMNPCYVFIEFEEQQKCGEKTWKKTNYLAKGVFMYTMSALQQCMLDEPCSSLADFLLLTVYFTFSLEHPYWHLSYLLEAHFVCLSFPFIFLDSISQCINHTSCTQQLLDNTHVSMSEFLVWNRSRMGFTCLKHSPQVCEIEHKSEMCFYSSVLNFLFVFVIYSIIWKILLDLWS